MGVHHQYYTNSSTSILPIGNNDFIWNNPNELDLLEMKMPSIKTTKQNQNCCLQVLPCIRRLFTIFDSLCPNIYRIHSSDSLTVLQEIICLTEQYLHIYPSSLIPTNQLLNNEKYFEAFISKLTRSSLPNRQKYHPSIKTEIRCFGQGIRPHDYHNELNQPILFCFELTTATKTHLLLPIDVLILDPNENLTSTNVKYINTYNQGYTKLFSCSYTPITKAGIYKISIFYNNIKMTHHTYTVFIRNSTLNYQKTEQLLSEDMIKKNPQGTKKTFRFCRVDNNNNRNRLSGVCLVLKY